LGDLHPEDKVEVVAARLEKAYSKYKDQGDNGLIKAILTAFKKEYFVTIGLNLI